MIHRRVKERRGLAFVPNDDFVSARNNPIGKGKNTVAQELNSVGNHLTLRGRTVFVNRIAVKISLTSGCAAAWPMMEVMGGKVDIFSIDSIDMVIAQNDSKGRCTLFGNLSPALILAAKTPDEVYEISRKLCEDMKPFGKFILAPGCDLAPTIPLENIQAMAKAARDS
ncbi:MAG: hypothetical protein II710_03160 [Clostridia bacterium]|nr:hypothetical protein [Clostridia bacterium]